jgi:hypothetical protein
MKVGKFAKQPYESYVIAGDFSLNMDQAGGEDIDLADPLTTVTAVDKNGDDATDDITDQGSIEKGTGDEYGYLKVLIKAGTVDLQPYKITFRAVTTAPEKWEKDVVMQIKEL